MAHTASTVGHDTAIVISADATPLGKPPAHLVPEQAIAWLDIVTNCSEPVPSSHALSLQLMAFLTAEYRGRRLRSDGLAVLLELLVLYGFETDDCRSLLDAGNRSLDEAMPTGPRLAVR